MFEKKRPVHLFESATRFNMFHIRKLWKKGEIVYFPTQAAQSLCDRFEWPGRDAPAEFEWSQITLVERGRTDEIAMQIVDRIFDDLVLKKSASARTLHALFRSDDVNMALRKQMAEGLNTCFQLLLMARILKAQGFESITIHTGIAWQTYAPMSEWRQTFPDLEELVGRSLRRDLNQRIFEFCQRLVYWILPLFLPLVFVVSLLRWRPQPKLSYKVCFRSYSTSFHFKSGTKIDWLIDGEELHNGNCSFVEESPIPPRDRKDYAQRGYEVIGASGLSAFKNLYFPTALRIASRSLRFIAECLASPGDGIPSLKLRAIALYNFYRWSAILSRLSMRHYVTYNDLSINNIFRNILMHQKNIETYFYVHSVHHPPTADRHSSLDASLMSYLNFAHRVNWGWHDKTIFANHSTGQAHVLGPLLCGGESSDEDNGKKLKDSLNPLVVGVFDTTFSRETLYSSEYCLIFARSLKEVFLEHEGCTLLFKEKLAEHDMRASLGPVDWAAYLELFDGKYMRRIPAHSEIQSASVIRLSNLVISIAYGSPAIVAWANGVPGIFFDPGGRYPHSYYSDMYKVVARTTDELKTLVNYWLQLSPNDLEKHLKGPLSEQFGSQLDTLAPSRFRHLLDQQSAH